jgi:hypothetical protein
MTTNPARILKGALWIQAVSRLISLCSVPAFGLYHTLTQSPNPPILQQAVLLVLTSILADSDAWVGAIVASVGFFLVVIGIVAAHKRRIGYLYCVSPYNWKAYTEADAGR